MNKNKKYENKKCIDCGILLNETNIKLYNMNSAKYICISCEKLRSQNKYQKERNIIRGRQKDYEKQIKLQVIENYGGKCVCCGETHLEFLTIDHIDDNGVGERKITNQGTGGKMYRWLKKNGYPKDNYQILCFNCNCSKGFHGYCPHQIK